MGGVMKHLLFLLLFSVSALAEDNLNNYQPDGYQPNAYGPGVHQDQYGRSFEWQTQQGQKVESWNQVQPKTYGPDTGMDQYGRPVRRQYGQ